MTKQEKFEKAKSDHKYAIERIEELEREMTKLRQSNNSKLVALKRLDPKTYGEIKPYYPKSNYEASRMEQG